MAGRLALLRRLRGPAFSRGLEFRACFSATLFAPTLQHGGAFPLDAAPGYPRLYVTKSSSPSSAQPQLAEGAPLTRIDEYGATSVVEETELDFKPTMFENVDGRRIEDGRYAAFTEEISGAPAWLPHGRVYAR